MTESDTNSNTYFESGVMDAEQQPSQAIADDNEEHDDHGNENENDIDIDADVDIASGDENLFGELDDDDENDRASATQLQHVQTPGNDTGTVMDVEELFGSDPEDAHDDDGGEPTQRTKELDREYKRSVPEGKKQSISSSLNMRTLPTSDEYEFCLIRLPNVVGCEAEPFDDLTYVEPTAAHTIDNFIRWRTIIDKATDETYKESNTRLVVWEDGTKSLVVGKDVYDIEETALPGDRDYIYAKLPIYSQSESASNASNTSYHACHSKVNTKMSVRTTTNKSYAKLQKNLTKKYERTKGSKQLKFGSKRSAANYDAQQQLRQRRNARDMSQRVRRNPKQKMDESFLTQGAHGNDSDEDDDDDDDDEDYRVTSNKKKGDDDDDDDDDSDSDSEEDNVPIGQRL